ncbi:hypothetical protein [Furfurilactobacillus entadae]|uniref:hypothetical protein n=1 Tax=Furfurilactobacillus entadae TaxID=2922307 RepID=UPI0035E98C78
MTDIERINSYRKYTNYRNRYGEAVAALHEHNDLAFLELVILRAISLGDRQALTVREEFNVVPSSISGWIKRLLGKGLIEDVSFDFDRRTRQYGLTETGETRLNQALDTLQALDQKTHTTE